VFSVAQTTFISELKGNVFLQEISFEFFFLIHPPKISRLMDRGKWGGMEMTVLT